MFRRQRLHGRDVQRGRHVRVVDAVPHGQQMLRRPVLLRMLRQRGLLGRQRVQRQPLCRARVRASERALQRAMYRPEDQHHALRRLQQELHRGPHVSGGGLWAQVAAHATSTPLRSASVNTDASGTTTSSVRKAIAVPMMVHLTAG